MTQEDVVKEADTVSQLVAELLEEYSQEDRWAEDLLTQVKSLGENARRVLNKNQPQS